MMQLILGRVCSAHRILLIENMNLSESGAFYMKVMYLFCLASVCSIFSIFSLTSVSHADHRNSHQFSAEQIEAIQKASSPGPEHKMLEQFSGDWSYTSRWWMDAESEPQTSSGKVENRMILDGRFLKQRHTGQAMGHPFEGISVVGFDNVRQHFSTLWIDNHSTGMASGTAVINRNNRRIEDRGTFSCPIEKSGEKKYRAVWSLPHDNTYTYEMFIKGSDGEEFRSMEIVYKK